MPRISVIMPLFNAEKYVEKAVKSILRQSYKDFELIMVDDCPKDATMDIVECIHDDRMHIYHNEKNMGISYSRNRALSKCSGEYVAIMDDDDISVPDRFKLEVEYLDLHKDVGAVGGRICFIDENDDFIVPFKEAFYNPKYMKAALLFRNPILNSSMMFRRDIIEQYGIKYRENYYGIEDFMFWVEFSKVSGICEMNEILAKYRVYHDNESNKNVKNNYLERAKKYADIQRYSLRCENFKLSDDEMAMFNQVFDEYRYRFKSQEEMNRVIILLNKIMDQAYEMDLDNKGEIAAACKNMFAAKVKNAEFLWSR